MTFYQFVHGELHKRAIRYRETKTLWVYTFPEDVWRDEIRFPKKESKQFDFLYGWAIERLARMMAPDACYVSDGLSTLAQAYDKEEAEYHAPFENTKTR